MVVAVPTPAPTTVEVCGLRVCSLESGRGQPLVVLHHSFGNPGWTSLFEDLSADHAVAVPDLPGFGASARPDWARHPRDIAILVGHWIRVHGFGRTALVGCGLGGWIAAELATMAPELLSGLVLVGAAGLAPREGEILDQIMINHSTYVRSAFSEPAAYEAVFGADLSDDLLLSLDMSREMVTRLTWKPYMYSHPLAALLSTISTPTLVVWGERDGVVPLDCGRQFAELIPGAQLSIVPGCGHAVDLEAPDALARLVRGHLVPERQRSPDEEEG
jgi:pimeloyl-ACP methyl ester carboxylesterase